MSEARSQAEDHHKFLIDNLPSLILSPGVHDLKGAVLAAQYITAGQFVTRFTQNLVDAVTYNYSRTISDIKYAEIINTPHKPEKYPLRLAYNGLERVGRPIRQYSLATSRAVALFSLIEYKVASEESNDPASFAADFNRVMEATNGMARGNLYSRWLLPYYRTILKKKQPTDSESAAAVAGREVAKEYSKDPGFFIMDLIDSRRERRLLKQQANK